MPALERVSDMLTQEPHRTGFVFGHGMALNMTVLLVLISVLALAACGGDSADDAELAGSTEPAPSGESPGSTEPTPSGESPGSTEPAPSGESPGSTGPADAGETGTTSGASSQPSFTPVASAAMFACGLRPDGSISCWGSSFDSDALDPPDGEFTSISGGGFHAFVPLGLTKL